LQSVPVEVKSVFLAPAERADLIVNFSGCAGQRINVADIEFLRDRLKQLERDVEGGRLHVHEIGKLLTTIDGIG
jgi:FtsP/CotA-like multicopper oxidase with cupredoxin domain